ncbi:MAG TPA: hypothetical protein VD962_09440 [Rubricoccaceae bacterium]|nr:hypothetical protein [Rubricoccaceae bacterium]
MSNEVLNTIILSVVMVLAVGAGLYVTKKVQPAELKRLEQEEETIRMAQAQVQDLLVQEAASAQQAAEAVARWNARYKILPAQLTSPEVVEYLNALSAGGFKSFDLSLGGVTAGNGYSVYTYNVTGEAYFESLYGFIWNVENGRGMYRVRDLTLAKAITTRPNPETEVERQEVMARFSFAIDAYFAGGEGMSAPDSVITLPAEAFPPRYPARNLIFPLVLEQLPPNTDDLVDVETDSLLSVVGASAVFLRNGEMRTLRAGDRVYLGRITRVDPNTARVVADLNKGGIRERIEMDLATGERFRQAFGSSQLTPTRGPVMASPPPQPGTPEARRRGLYRPAPLPGEGASGRQ